jgi:hypothetical protein
MHKISSGILTHSGLKRANIILKINRNQDDLQTLLNISHKLSCSIQTIINVKKRFAKKGIGCITGKRKIDEDFCRCVINLACSAPPKGHKRWTLQLIADRISVITGKFCSRTSIDMILKKSHVKI